MSKARTTGDVEVVRRALADELTADRYRAHVAAIEDPDLCDD